MTVLIFFTHCKHAAKKGNVKKWQEAFFKPEVVTVNYFLGSFQRLSQKNVTVTTSSMKNLPKVELHLHLEGAIPLPALWEIIEKYGGDPSVPDVTALEKKFQYRDFPHFIDAWQWKNGFLP